VADSECNECGGRLLSVEFHRDHSPLPDTQLYTGCLFCDPILEQTSTYLFYQCVCGYLCLRISSTHGVCSRSQHVLSQEPSRRWWQRRETPRKTRRQARSRTRQRRWARKRSKGQKSDRKRRRPAYDCLGILNENLNLIVSTKQCTLGSQYTVPIHITVTAHCAKLKVSL